MGGTAEKYRRKPSQERSRQTVDAILEAAAQVFEERGLAGGTTDRVAARAGVSVGSLYQYFPDKKALLAALALRHVEEEVALARAWVGQVAQVSPDAPEALRAVLAPFILALLARHRRRPRLMRLLLEENTESPQMEALLARWEDEMAMELRPLLLRFPRGQDPMAPWLVLHLVQGLVHHFVVHPPPQVPEARFVETLVDLVVLALADPGPRGLP